MAKEYDIKEEESDGIHEPRLGTCGEEQEQAGVDPIRKTQLIDGLSTRRETARACGEATPTEEDIEETTIQVIIKRRYRRVNHTSYNKDRRYRRVNHTSYNKEKISKKMEKNMTILLNIVSITAII